MRILAIDIGSANIKSVILETKFKRFDITFYNVTPVSDALEAFTPGEQILSLGQIMALSEIKQKFSTGVDHIVTNLPFSLYSSRLMTFPFKDKKKIDAAAKFAIEDEIPFSLEDCSVSSHIYPGAGKESHVLIGYSTLQSLEQFISITDKMHLSAQTFTMDQAALASFLQKQKMLDSTSAILNIGHRKSSIFLFRKNVPVLHRTTMIGGYHLTKAIAEKYDISMAEAELAKIDRAFLPHADLPDLSSDQKAFADLLQNTLDPLFSNMRQSLMAFSSRYAEPIESVYVMGGSSLIPGLAPYLSDRWGKRVLPLEVSNQFPNISIHPQINSESMLPMATAIGLSQLAGESKSTINFRQGKLRGVNNKSLNLNLSQFIYPAKLVFAIYICAFLSLLGQSFFLRAQINRKDAQFEQSIQGIFGKVSSSYMSSLKGSPTKLKEGVKKKLDELSAQLNGGGETTFSVLELIEGLSKDIPKTDVVEIKQMDLTPTNLTMQLESPSEKDANAVISVLKQVPYLTSVKPGPLLPAAGQRKKFAIITGVNKKKEAN